MCVCDENCRCMCVYVCVGKEEEGNSLYVCMGVEGVCMLGGTGRGDVGMWVLYVRVCGYFFYCRRK